MRYNKFGNTGMNISALGFGAMRLPMEGDKINDELAVPLLQRAFDLGVNYVDTAFFYCGGNSEYTVGKALKGYRDRVYLSTKFPIKEDSTRSDYRSTLEEQLRKLDQEYIDCYHFHGINLDRFKNTILKNDLIKEAQKAKDEGLIKHISFSFHDTPQAMMEIIDSGYFESVLCQYNMLFRDNEEAIKYAHDKGLGVVVMGPVGGGNLSYPIREFEKSVGDKCGTPELALRFVMSNPNVSCALSGMSNMQMLEENAKVASDSSALTEEERKTVLETCDKLKKLTELYCTGCEYCKPHCPKHIHIPYVFQTMNLHRVYGLTEVAKKKYAAIGSEEWMGVKPSECIECGECEKYCPQHIEIRKQLKEVVSVLGEE